MSDPFDDDIEDFDHEEAGRIVEAIGLEGLQAIFNGSADVDKAMMCSVFFSRDAMEKAGITVDEAYETSLHLMKFLNGLIRKGMDRPGMWQMLSVIANAFDPVSGPFAEGRGNA